MKKNSNEPETHFDAQLKLDDWIIQPNKNKLIKRNNRKETKHIEPRSMRLLMLLIKRQGETVSKDEIADSIWDGIASDDAIAATVARLRRAMGESAGQPKHIHTIPTRGYRFDSNNEIAAEPVTRNNFQNTNIPDYWIIGGVISLVILIVTFSSLHQLLKPHQNDPVITRSQHLLSLGEEKAAKRAESLLLEETKTDQRVHAWLTLADLYSSKSAALIGYDLTAASNRFKHAMDQAENAGATIAQLSLKKASHAFYFEHDIDTAKKFLSNSDEQTEARLYLSSMVLAREQKFNEAFEKLDEGLQLYPNSERLANGTKWVAYLALDAQDALEKMEIARTWTNGDRWVDALIYMKADQPLQARTAWLDFYEQRDGYLNAAEAYSNNLSGFNDFISSLDRSGSANCMDRAIAAATINNLQALKIENEKCVIERHPLSVWIPIMPILIEQ